ncbi:MAG: methionyl-tRNA formyltransferase [Pseudomonadota bacterium]
MARIIFMGTPDFSVPTLRALIDAGHEIAAVYAQPPRPAGRAMKLRPTPVHAFAEAAALDVRTPTSLKDEGAQRAFADLAADAAVVIAYGLLLPRAILDAPTHGCFNLHASALPRWRGAAPIQRAVMAGDDSTAAIVMRMDEGLDTGPICLAETVAIGPDMTAGDLHDDLAVRGAALMMRALAALEAGTLTCRPQVNDGVTYAAKIEKAEARIDFTKPAAAVHNQIRGLSPFPGAWCLMPVQGKTQGERVKVLRTSVIAPDLKTDDAAPGTVLDEATLTIACGTGAVSFHEVQRAGKTPMDAAIFQRGAQVQRGSVLA